MRRYVFTIGHSNQPLDRFLSLLTQHRIKALVDIRRFPSSKMFPHFNQSNLETTLPEAGIEYYWMEALGGRRQHVSDSSRNLGLQNAGFRNYADYMLTAEFQRTIKDLLKIASRKRTVIMCAEALFRRCHRRLVSDFLLAIGVGVRHIMPNGDLRPHQLTEGALIEDKTVMYPGEKTLFS